MCLSFFLPERGLTCVIDTGGAVWQSRFPNPQTTIPLALEPRKEHLTQCGWEWVHGARERARAHPACNRVEVLKDLVRTTGRNLRDSMSAYLLDLCSQTYAISTRKLRSVTWQAMSVQS